MIHVGTSGWMYDSWRGPFYPQKLAKHLWLERYASVFPVVEVNNSFYHLPKEETFDKWREESPPEFEFVVKASRYITHIRRLRDCRDPVELLWSRAARLKDKVGPVLFQLPPRFGADAGLLGDFLSVLPSGIRAAFEFRDDSWRRDDVYELLDRSGAAWVLADRPRWRVPLIVTGGWSYVRFHQGRTTHPGYTRAKLRAWADRIAELAAREVYVFFNNDTWAAAPADARTLVGLLLDKQLEVAAPIRR
jgi:uncharacterized protein YecE (DUF72 family)